MPASESQRYPSSAQRPISRGPISALHSQEEIAATTIQRAFRAHRAIRALNALESRIITTSSPSSSQSHPSSSSSSHSNINSMHRASPMLLRARAAELGSLRAFLSAQPYTAQDPRVRRKMEKVSEMLRRVGESVEPPSVVRDGQKEKSGAITRTERGKSGGANRSNSVSYAESGRGKTIVHTHTREMAAGGARRGSMDHRPQDYKGKWLAALGVDGSDSNVKRAGESRNSTTSIPSRPVSSDPNGSSADQSHSQQNNPSRLRASNGINGIISTDSTAQSHTHSTVSKVPVLLTISEASEHG